MKWQNKDLGTAIDIIYVESRRRQKIQKSNCRGRRKKPRRSGGN